MSSNASVSNMIGPLRTATRTKGEILIVVSAPRLADDVSDASHGFDGGRRRVAIVSAPCRRV